MSKKSKSKIFEQLDKEQTEDLEQLVSEPNTDELNTDVSDESIVENVPDDPEQLDLFNDKLNQVQQLTNELNNTKKLLSVANKKIVELENKIQKLQNDNDILIIKLAEAEVKKVEKKENVIYNNQQKAKKPSAVTMAEKNQSMYNAALGNAVQYYNKINYSKNGYESWN